MTKNIKVSNAVYNILQQRVLRKAHEQEDLHATTFPKELDLLLEEHGINLKEVE